MSSASTRQRTNRALVSFAAAGRQQEIGTRKADPLRQRSRITGRIPGQVRKPERALTRVR
jgi:hypothetical protein